MKTSPLYQIRHATAADQASIRSLIRKVRINPLGLDWRRFCLAVDQDGDVIGCGQIKLHKDGSRELASIAVRETWRNQAVATHLILHLMGEENGPLWLMCRSDLVSFYKKFGFYEVSQMLNMPPNFRLVVRLWGILSKVRGGRRVGSVMVWNRGKKAG
jgi:N-acetylglutamate synthase-like GNAT family acetyltransferase